MSVDTLYWAYVSFVDIKGGKTRPVLLVRNDHLNYYVFRLTSKYQKKSDFFKNKYIEVKDWQKAGLPKPSWIDTFKLYELPIATTKLTFIGRLSPRDLKEIGKYIDLNY